ncbi:hypothetical protein IVB25_05965 [Bradyrhizobium sp. 193]|uniref:hypothetical protein n=1 Tax=unclassified Bradyrhizobium TaxID=2631580 RepID=UPI001FF97ED0|nr:MULTISPECIES: hypothetical protein [unclassified Bradyrhizobium]MCK1468518.1 hypothetical protein [Bradyrhizobium sp. CW10]MCK1482278.1 hypothetical protein [Bradyrhizobium sp. 193]MCK1584792.1 hypothetical protein [Bradyrhizobium sp. 168]UPK21998.1 hypothetical protein IVA73_14295 [Bradyrhizobium sp. 131]
MASIRQSEANRSNAGLRIRSRPMWRWRLRSKLALLRIRSLRHDLLATLIELAGPGRRETP